MRLGPGVSWLKRAARSVALVGLLGMAGAIPAGVGPAAAGAGGGFAPLLIRRTTRVAVAAPPSDAQCRAVVGGPCYSPQEIQTAYGISSLLKQGDDGKGQTIVLIDSFGSPTIQQDLRQFDAGYGLPDPPSLRVLAPLGTVPFDPTNGDMVNWAAETTLDVEWAHAMAPGASIVVLTSPADETEGVAGMPQFASLLQYALDHHLGQVISQSWGATENTLFTPQGQAIYRQFEQLYARAAAERVTVFASAGDQGVANYTDASLTSVYPFPTVIYPASSPFVTAVGGTSLYADTGGNYQSETVWNDGDSAGATGGGISQKFGLPFYQLLLPAKAQSSLGGHRGLPDVAYNADPNTAILIYLSFLGPDFAGYYFIGGTSEGSPQWAGIIADADQLAGRPLGFLNPTLYALEVAGVAGRDFHDVTVGDNSQDGITGYSAGPGWDLTTGFGTPNLGALARRMAEASH